MRGFVSILEAFLAIALIYIVLGQIQLNMPARYSDSSSMEKLSRYSHDIAFSLCGNMKVKRSLLTDVMSFDLGSVISPDICYKVSVFENSSDNHLLNSLVYNYTTDYNTSQNESTSNQTANNSWVETNISDEPSDVRVVVIGDANNDGKNEVIIGLSSGSQRLRMYENKSGGWVETNISGGPADVNSVTIGDANNDGKNEVVIGMGSSTNEVRMYENKTGKWVETNISNALNNVWSVAVGDANRDGLNEVVIGMASSKGVRMYENKSGTWVETNISDTPATVYSVAIGDANRDGLNEVVIGMLIATNEVRMYENKSGGWVETNISDTPLAVFSVAIGDANNDGKNELVIGILSNEVRMYENKTGKWVETNISNVPANVNSVTIGDANNNGNKDVVIGMSSTTNEMRMYENKTGAWVETNISDEPTNVNSIAIGDANNDGIKDLVIGMGSTTNEVRMYTYSPTCPQGTMNSSTSLIETNVSDGSAGILSLAVGDSNNNGKKDIVAGTVSNASTYYYSDDFEDGNFDGWMPGLGQNGKINISSAYAYNSNYGVRLYQNESGSGVYVTGLNSKRFAVSPASVLNFTFKIVTPATAVYGTALRIMIVADDNSWYMINYDNDSSHWGFTMDGYEVVTPNVWYTRSLNITSLWISKFGHAPLTPVQLTFHAYADDCISESYIDNITLSNTSGDEVKIYENTTGTWSETSIGSENSSIFAIATGDANNDGSNDVVVGMYGGINKVRMYENKTGGWAVTNISSAIGQMVYGIAIGDANNDGLKEIAIGMYNGSGSLTNSVRMYENMSGGWAETNISGAANINVISLAIGDVNNDGKREIVIGAASTTNEVRMYENKTGGWVETNISDESTDVESVAIGDANNDGKNELVVGTYTSSSLKMYENKSGGWVETNINSEYTAIYSIAIEDADNDGKNEVTIGQSPINNETRMYKNTSGTWVETNISDVLSFVYGVAVGDVNNDGKNEIVMGAYSTTNELRMYSYTTSTWCTTAGNVTYQPCNITSTTPSATSSCLIAGGPNSTNYSAYDCRTSCLDSIISSNNARVNLLSTQNFTVAFSPGRNGTIVEFFLEGSHNQSGTTSLYDSAGNQVAAYNFAVGADEGHTFDLSDFFPDPNGVYNITVKPSVNASYDYAYLNVSANIYSPKMIAVQTWNYGN